MPKSDPGLDETATPEPALAATTVPTAPEGDAAIEPFPQLSAARYKLGAEVGRGGLGRVIRARDQVLDRDVAIKELHSSDDGGRARFVREALITARLQHPSIVPIYEAGRWKDGSPFYAMKLVSGRPFGALIAEAKTLTERLALLPMVLAVTDALAYAHRHRIVHRDLKPGNILVGEFGEVVVIDWGLAKDLSIDDRDALDAGPYRASNHDQTVAGSLLGTPAYMAPEQAAAEEVDERADVYALGAILYHVITGITPHTGDSLEVLIRQIIAGDITPLTKLEASTPLDLAAIVAKAMHREREQRYASAKELASELRRFQTGQLVGSYRYSRLELVKRFVRRHRVPVVIASAAVLVLAIGGTIAVTGIMGERNRADAEAQRARSSEVAAVEAQRRAEDRTDRLVLEQARTKVATNPTEAIAMLKPLATKHWREVRSIAVAARARGVAWSLPGPPHAVALELSRDGTRALVAGDDGSVRIYDLAKRSAQLVIERGPRVGVRFADDARKLVTWTDARLVVRDATSGAQLSELATQATIRDLEVVGSVMYWVDVHGALWQLDGTAPVAIAVAERVDQITPSPDGRWIALAGESHLLLFDRTQPTAPPAEVLVGKTIDLDWSHDGGHLVALVEQGDPGQRSAVEIMLEPVPVIARRVNVGLRSGVTFSGGRMFTVGPTGVGVIARSGSESRMQLVGDPFGIAESEDGAVVAASHGGIAVLTDDGDHALHVPSGRLETFVASEHSPYVVGAVAGRVLAWNLSEIRPRTLAVRVPMFARFVGSHVIAAFPDDELAWIDLATRKTASLGSLAPIVEVASSRDGRTACVIELARRAHLVTGGEKPVSIGNADLAVYAGEQLVLATGGTIETYNPAGRTQLVSRAGKVAQLAASRTTPWIAAVFVEDAKATLWRMNLTRGAQTTTALATVPEQIFIDHDGTVGFTDGRRVSMWRGTGAPAPLVELPARAVAVGIAGRDVVAFTDDNRGFLVNLDAPAVATPFDLSGMRRGAMAADAGLIVLENRGALEVIDPRAPHRVAFASPGVRFQSPAISADGRHVLANRSLLNRDAVATDALVVWELVLPGTASATAAHLDALTNAIVNPMTAELGWSR